MNLLISDIDSLTGIEEESLKFRAGEKMPLRFWFATDRESYFKRKGIQEN